MPNFKSFLDRFRIQDDDEYDDEEYDDDIFDDDEDDEIDDVLPSFGRRNKKAPAPSEERPSYSRPLPEKEPRVYRERSTPAQHSTPFQRDRDRERESRRPSYSSAPAPAPQPSFRASSNVMSMAPAPVEKKSSYRPSSEVYVIKPQEFDDAQTVADFLKTGKTIVINLEGLEIDPAQRIIDFIGGACYGINGELKAISSNIFIAAPDNIEVSGDLREEIETTLSPQLGRY